MKIYGLKNCDSCRSARKALIEFTFFDVKETFLPQETLELALKKFGDSLVNKRSTTWRGLSEEARDQAPIDLLRAYPALMKRPLIVDGDEMTLGWTATVQAAYGLGD